MLAQTALQLQKCLYARKAGAEGMEEAIAFYLDSLRRSYIADFGIEPNWQTGIQAMSEIPSSVPGAKKI
jgi:hypothetical protein